MPRKALSLFGLLVAAVILGGVLIWNAGWLPWFGSNGSYKAVFLSNGQVYFGHVKNERADPVVLTDIYYLQVQQPLQPAKDNKDQANQQIQLIKLGNELHGPKDVMRINRAQVLFIEELKDDSQVVKTIKTAQQQGQSGASTSAPSEGTKK